MKRIFFLIAVSLSFSGCALAQQERHVYSDCNWEQMTHSHRLDTVQIKARLLSIGKVAHTLQLKSIRRQWRLVSDSLEMEFRPVDCDKKYYQPVMKGVASKLKAVNLHRQGQLLLLTCVFFPTPIEGDPSFFVITDMQLLEP